jgi:putative SOS response-associated peptidase YedK
MGLLKWGLVPFWAKDPKIGNRMINARAETAADKPAFRQAFQRRRCLVPADGFFEWKKVESGDRQPSKTPYWIHRADRGPFVMAGLWERWEPRNGPPLHTFTILTTDAVPELRPIHPRMPVILPQDSAEEWLDPGSRSEELTSLLRPFGAGLQSHPVSTVVNSPRNDGPECIESVS